MVAWFSTIWSKTWERVIPCLLQDSAYWHAGITKLQFFPEAWNFCTLNREYSPGCCGEAFTRKSNKLQHITGFSSSLKVFSETFWPWSHVLWSWKMTQEGQPQWCQSCLSISACWRWQLIHVVNRVLFVWEEPGALHFYMLSLYTCWKYVTICYQQWPSHLS